jgi:DNA helicase-2/ATP-dependent DNA helicase PcrA
MPWDDKLSPEQKAIVLDPARIKVVRAGPGTGKTRLFVAALQKELAGWSHAKAGIAALSYTNVAQQQIAERAGHIPPPHLTTTIDGFILRFIIRPFAHLITENVQGTRLLPAIIAKHHAQAEVKIGTNNAQRSKLADIMYIGRDDHGHVQMTGLTAYKTTPVHDQQRAFVLGQKQRFWKDQGLLTHSDTHYLAYRILHDPAHGNTVAGLIAQRFPTILVDEYQDTNFFLALTLKKLLAQDHVRGLIVGDTDQAIYEFGGAHPRLFDELETLPGAKTFPLRKTHRCPTNVANVATFLAHSHNPVEPTNEQGRSLLLAHQGDPTILYDVLIAGVAAGERIAILARRTNTIDRLKGYDHPEFPGGCKLAEHLSMAASTLRTSASKAGQLTSAALASVLLNNYYPTKTTLEQHQITLRQWRQAVWHLLTSAASTTDGETWYDWVLRLRPALAMAATMVGITLEQQKVTAVLRATTAMQVPRKPAPPPAPPSWPEGTMLSTVHGVKGDEFEIVALYYPKPKPQGMLRCISKQWWSDQDTEERRVAFVATTRAMRTFILCVHNDTYTALQTEQPAFFASFGEHIGPPVTTAAPPRAAPRRRTRQPVFVPNPLPP